MQCTQCGGLLPNTAPKFCPSCGAPVAHATPAAAQQIPYQPQAWNAPDKKSVWITVGLFVAAWLTWGDGPSPGALPALAWLAAVVLIILDTLMPAWWASLQLPKWLRRPLLGTIAAGVFVLTTALVSGLSLGFICWAAATVIFLRDAMRRGELGPFDPRLLLRGWRMLVLIGITLASLAFAASWEPTISVSGYYSSEYRADGRYSIWNSGYRMGGQADAHSQGAATVPALLMLAVLVVCAYRGENPVVRKVGRFLPVIVAPLLILWGIKWSLTPGWVNSNSMASAYSAEGPGYFVFLGIPYYVGAIALALGREQWGRRQS